MNNFHNNHDDINIINSILSVKASGAICDVSADLASEPTKTIAQLLDDETQQEHQNTDTN